MKLLITGGTGTIGKPALLHALLRPEITSIIALSRRDLPRDIANNPKLKTLIVKDFHNLSQDVLEEIKDADAMIWALGTSDNQQAPNLEYPLAFQNSIIKVLGPRTGKPAFRYIHGLAETRSMEFEKAHSDVWRTFIVRPGGVMANNSLIFGTITAITRGLFIGDEELGAFMVDLAITGDEQGQITEHAWLVEKGKELLRQGK